MQNKMINAIKSSSIAIYNSIDLSLTGLLSQIKSNITTVYEGFFEEKIYNLIFDLKRNSITENEILNYIDTMGEYDKNILFSIIQKNIASEHKIKTFLLSKIWFYKIKNDELDYFYNSLLNQIDVFIFKDFEHIYYMSKNSKVHPKENDIFSIEYFDENIISTVSKLFANGLLLDSNLVGGNFHDKAVSFKKTDNFNKLVALIKEYFEEIN